MYLRRGHDFDQFRRDSMSGVHRRKLLRHVAAVSERLSLQSGIGELGELYQEQRATELLLRLWLCGSEVAGSTYLPVAEWLLGSLRKLRHHDQERLPKGGRVDQGANPGHEFFQYNNPNFKEGEFREACKCAESWADVAQTIRNRQG
jgi:hypothetical protein